jgi:replicative DNA helicase
MNPKLPPQSLDAEMSVLGAVFVDNGSVGKIKTLIHRDDFYTEAHRLLYSTFCEMYATKTPIDFVTVVSALKSAGTLDVIGGAAYLLALADFVPTAANVAYYCAIVRNKSLRRRLISNAQEMLANAYDEQCNLTEALDSAKGNLLSVSGDASHLSLSHLLTLEDRAERYLHYVKNVGTMRFRTGFGDIDNHIRGVAPGEVMTIIAYSGTFKSALLQNLLNGNAERTSLHQIFFSLEMPVEKVFEREVQMQCGLAGRQVEQDYSGREWKDHHAKMLKRGSNRVLVCDKSRLSVDRIASYVEMARHKYGAIGGIGIDYLGLMQAEGKSIFDKVSALSADIKGMAKDLQIPVVVLCQVNRGYATSKNLEIEMDAAKGGGDIEAGADFMLGMWAKDEQVFAKLLKNRNGQANLRWEMEINRETLEFIGTKDFIAPVSEEPEKPYGKREKYNDLPKF